MNGRKAKELRRLAKHITDSASQHRGEADPIPDIEYKDIVHDKMKVEMGSGGVGLVQHQLITRVLSPVCTRSWYQDLKKGVR